jgi:hypothetical protein
MIGLRFFRLPTKRVKSIDRAQGTTMRNKYESVQKQANIELIAALLLAIFAGAGAGCAATTLPADPRSPEQIEASAKDKSATIECTVVHSVWVSMRTARGSVDKGSLGSGGATVSADPETCKMNISITPKDASPK